MWLVSDITFLSGRCLFFLFFFFHFTSQFFFVASFIPQAFLTPRVCADLSVREECKEDPHQSDEAEAEMSPPKSPSTPKNVKSKNSGTVHHSVSPSPPWEPACGKTKPNATNAVSEPGAFRGALPTELPLAGWLLPSAVLSIWEQLSTSCDPLLFHNLPVIKPLSWQGRRKKKNLARVSRAGRLTASQC